MPAVRIIMMMWAVRARVDVEHLGKTLSLSLNRQDLITIMSFC
jgi:hypothetical protein